MLIVAPSGSIKRVTLLSTLLFSSKHLNVIGKVAELEPKNMTWIKIKNIEKTQTLKLCLLQLTKLEAFLLKI